MYVYVEEFEHLSFCSDSCQYKPTYLNYSLKTIDMIERHLGNKPCELFFLSPYTPRDKSRQKKNTAN